MQILSLHKSEFICLKPLGKSVTSLRVTCCQPCSYLKVKLLCCLLYWAFHISVISGTLTVSPGFEVSLKI